MKFKIVGIHPFDCWKDDEAILIGKTGEAPVAPYGEYGIHPNRFDESDYWGGDVVLDESVMVAETPGGVVAPKKEFYFCGVQLEQLN